MWNLDKMLKDRGMKPADLARETGIPKSTIYKNVLLAKLASCQLKMLTKNANKKAGGNYAPGFGICNHALIFNSSHSASIAAVVPI